MDLNRAIDDVMHDTSAVELDKRDLHPRVFAAIWEEELDLRCTDRSIWPTGRTFTKFHQWFDISFHSLLLDLSDELLK